MKRHLALLTISFLMFLNFGCSGESSSGQYYEQEPEPRPYPSREVQEAKDMMDRGAILYSRAVNADDQDEKDRLAREALDECYFPAQAILDRLKEQYPEHEYSIDSLYQELNRKILDANRIMGFGG
jgi:hypothetical protein